MAEQNNKTEKFPSTAGRAGSAALVGLLIAYSTVFVSSFCLMVIELVAGKLIAKHLGSSLYTWTSIIGVVLGGIALGNFLGGRVADRFALDARRTRRTLGVLFLTAGVVASGINWYNEVVGQWDLLLDLENWPLRVATHIALVFFLPSVLLGLIGPVVAKRALELGRRTGRTVGSVYAWGVIGSIIGTFFTGYYLVGAFPIPVITLATAVVLVLVAVLYGLASLLPSRS